MPDERNRGAGIPEILVDIISLPLPGHNRVKLSDQSPRPQSIRSDVPAFGDEVLTLKQVHSLNVSHLGTILK